MNVLQKIHAKPMSRIYMTQLQNRYGRGVIFLLFENYRVSIKSFPDDKHLLQENYVEYKHIFLPLRKLDSKLLCHVFTVTLQKNMFAFHVVFL